MSGTTNLTEASNEWANRPADERFETLGDMWLATKWSHDKARTNDLKMKGLRIVAEGTDLRLVDSTVGNQLRFTNWSFGQFASRIGAPGSYLQTLPAELAADALNYGLARSADIDVQLYYDEPSTALRAVTSPKYGRLPNYEVVGKLMGLGDRWKTPPARPVGPNQPGARKATKADLIRNGHPVLGINEGDMIAPAGLYASDRDMFVFLVNDEARIDDGTPEGLGRGFFVRNSEVGNATFELTMFLYRHICGNHIVWDASEVTKVSFKHLGRGIRDRAFGTLEKSLKTYGEQSAQDDEARIRRAKDFSLGDNKDDVVEFLFDKRGILGKKRATEAYEMAEMFAGEDGSPRSVWGIVNGITRISQNTTYADERAALDSAAGKVLALAA